MIKQNKLPNPGLVLNGEKINSGSNYAYKYGYNYIRSNRHEALETTKIHSCVTNGSFSIERADHGNLHERDFELKYKIPLFP